MGKYRWMIVVIIFIFLTNAGISHAETKAEDFFNGKYMNLIVPYSPGGGYDLYARMIIPTLEKYTGSRVVPSNIPGGGALIGTNTLFIAKPTGLTIGILNGTALTLSQMIEQKGVKYDMNRFTMLGRLSADEEFIYIGAKSPYKTLEALLSSKDKGTKWVTDGKATSLYYRVALVCDLLKLHRAKIMTGYPGSAEANLAIIRGDADGTAGTYDSRQSQVDAGEFIPVLILGKKRSKDFPKVPTIYEVPGLNDGDRRLADFLVGLDQLGRLIAAPPMTDREKVNHLRTVLKRVCEDSDMVARAKKQKRELDYAPHDQVEQMIRDVLKAPLEIKKRIDEALKRYD